MTTELEEEVVLLRRMTAALLDSRLNDGYVLTAAEKDTALRRAHDLRRRLQERIDGWLS